MRIFKYECPQLTLYPSKDKPNCALKRKDGVLIQTILFCITMYDGNYINQGILYQY